MKLIKYTFISAVVIGHLVLTANVFGQGRVNAPGQNKPTQTAVLTSVPKPTKYGPQNLRNIISRSVTDSAQVSSPGAKGRRIGQLKTKKATPSAQLRRRAVSGVITGIEANVLTIAHLVHRERIYQVVATDTTVFTMKGNNAPAIADLKLGDRVTAVGDYADGKLTARRIHVIPGAASGIFLTQPVSTATVAPTNTVVPTAAPTASPT